MPVTHKFGDTAILREILTDTYHEFSAYSYRELLKCLECRTCPPSLHPSDRRLGGTHSMRQIGLSQPCLYAQSVHESSKCTDPCLIFVSGTTLFAKRPLGLDIVPTHSFGHMSYSSSVVCPSEAHRSIACFARRISLRSCRWVFMNTVRRMILRPGAIQYVIRVGRPDR